MPANTLFNHESYEVGPFINVIGVGGAGGKAVEHLVRLGIKDVRFVVCDTDHQALANRYVSTKLRFGEGIGTGEEGEKAARNSIDNIRNLLAPPIRMVFITAGMGGGTGTGAAPVVAEVARELNLLTVAVVMAPHRHEGMERKKQALAGIEKLKRSCDTVLVVLNDKLDELYSDLDKREAYAHAHNVLANAVSSITDIITTQGDINADFDDVKKVLSNAGSSVMGVAEADGDNRALKAIEAALDFPLLKDRDIRGAKRVMMAVATSKIYPLMMKELTVISRFVNDKIQVEAQMVKVGAITDATLGTKLHITIIVTGFDVVNDLGEF